MTGDIVLERDRIARIRERCKQVCDDMDKVLDALAPDGRRVDAGAALRRRVQAEDAAARELCRQVADEALGAGPLPDPDKDWPDYLAQARAVLMAAANAA